MTACDFVVRYDPEKDKPEDITDRIFYSIFIKRLKANKPCILFICGDSGEGKSWGGLRFQEILLKLQGIDSLTPYLEAINVYTPLQYPQKIERLLFDKDLKKINIIDIHEAREALKSAKWREFTTQAIGDINAMSRTIKRLIVMMTAQFIRDITPEMRYTISHYIKITRPKGRKARANIQIFWKDDRDPDKPKLRKRKLAGYLVDKEGRYRRFIPKYFELNRPSPEVVELFEKQDKEAKAYIIKNKISKLIAELKNEIGEQSDKISTILNFYVNNPENISLIGKRYKGQFRVNPDFRKMHDLNQDEAERFQDLLVSKIKEMGMEE